METAISGRAQSPCGRGTGFACARKLGLVIRSEPLRIFAALGFNCLMMPHCCVVKRSEFVRPFSFWRLQLLRSRSPSPHGPQTPRPVSRCAFATASN